MNLTVALIAVIAICALAGLLGGSAPFVVGVVIPYLALVAFFFGITIKVLQWAKIPVPFRIPTTCGQQKSLKWIKHERLDNPQTTLQVLGRMALEILCFRSLFRNTKMELHHREDKPRVVYGADRWLWLAALVFHYSFLLVLLRHTRLFAEPVPRFTLLLQQLDGFFQIGAPVVYITSVALLLAVTFLLARRLWIAQVRYISLLSDYFPLLVILGIAVTGVLLRHFIKTDVVEIKQLAVGLATFQPIVPGNAHWLFYVHLTLVSVLFGYFPFSKLMHAPGVFLSPTRNMSNNNRAVRHINPWNYPVKVHTYEEWEDDFREKMVACGLPVDKPLEPKEEPKEDGKAKQAAPEKDGKGQPAAPKKDQPAAKEPADAKPSDEEKDED